MRIDRIDFFKDLLQELYKAELSCVLGNTFDLPQAIADISARIELSEARLSITIKRTSSEKNTLNSWELLIKECLNFPNIPKLGHIRFVDEAGVSLVDPKGSKIVELSSPLIDIYDDNELKKHTFDLLQSLEILISKYGIKVSESEGSAYKSLVKRYERSPVLRSKAIEIHGLCCVVCGFNFLEKYGVLGKDFIHIHHLERLADTGERWVDPQTDLIPVCPNCHAMLHKKIPPYLPEELRSIIEKA